MTGWRSHFAWIAAFLAFLAFAVVTGGHPLRPVNLIALAVLFVVARLVCARVWFRWRWGAWPE